MVIIRANKLTRRDQLEVLAHDIKEQAKTGVIVLPSWCELLSEVPVGDEIQIVQQKEDARVAALEKELAAALAYISASKDCTTCKHEFAKHATTAATGNGGVLMGKIIDVKATKEFANTFLADPILKMAVNAVLDNAPAVEAVPVVHARWENVKETEMYVPDMKFTTTHTAETCSACKCRIGFIGAKLYLYDKICPECGALMDGKVETNGTE
jgi:hypothetical protein